MKFSRKWAMPDANTFSIPPISEFVKAYLVGSQWSLDPFARNGSLADVTNDLNPNTGAQYHLDAEEFLLKMAVDFPDRKADLVFFDPPYSPRQISECYQSIGKPVGMKETQSAVLYQRVRNAMLTVLSDEAIVLSFGWNTVGMGKKRGFKIMEIMLVCHGGAHNDTICLAEDRWIDNEQGEMAFCVSQMEKI